MTNKFISWGKNGLAFAAATILAAGIAGGTAAAEGAKIDYKPWVKICPKTPKDGPKLCVTRADGIDAIKGLRYAPISLEKVDGKGEFVVITLPHVWPVPAKAKNKKTNEEINIVAPGGVRWSIGPGAIVQVDKNKPFNLKYVYCDQFGCRAQAEATKELISEMKKGEQIMIAGINVNKPFGLPVPLKGFGDAYDGKPVDEAAYNKAWEERIAKQVQMMQQQAAAAQKKAADAQKKK